MIPTLVDTNILLRLLRKTSIHHRMARGAITKLRRSGCQLFLVSQNLNEFWSVATRPVMANGLGHLPSLADRLIDRFDQIFTVLQDNLLVYAKWRKLVLDNKIVGRQVHDAQIAAAMTIHQIPQVLTFNLADFRRFPSIIALDPAAVISIP